LSNNPTFEESLKAVHHAEEAVYKAQANSNMEERQKAFQQLQIAKDKVHAATQKINNEEGLHRLHQAGEHLRHLSEAQQSLED
jgi:superoxide dismutase